MSVDIHALSGAYAVDAVDDLERVQFERHLAECASCRAEVESLREAATLLAETSLTEAPAALRSRVLSGIETVRPLPPLLPTDSHRTGHRTTAGRRRIPALVAVAAALVVAAGVGVSIAQPWDDQPGQEVVAPVSDIDRVMQAADAETKTQKVGDGTVTVVRSPGLNQAVLMTDGLDANPAADDKAPSDAVRELWLLHDNGEGTDFVKAGLLPVGEDVTLLMEGDPATAAAAAITLEGPGGSPHPTRAPFVTLEFENA